MAPSVTAFRFIEPCSPVLAEAVPTGPDWIHEVKFDGYRVQAHKHGTDVAIFSRNGNDFTTRFDVVAYQLRDLPAKAAILDGELVASNRDGTPDFAGLHRRSVEAHAMHFWCFDLLALNGRDLRPDPLAKRRARLQALLGRFDCPAVLPSESFGDGLALLRVAEKRRLEGVVSKRRDAPYRSGDCKDWRKVKTAAWRTANRERWRLFEG
jgi:bifunctional non-homologous end joining protein LigD